MSDRLGMLTGQASSDEEGPNLAKEIKKKVNEKNNIVATDNQMDWLFEGIAEAVIEHLQANLVVKTNVNTSTDNVINTIVIPNSLVPAQLENGLVKENLKLGEGDTFEVK